MGERIRSKPLLSVFLLLFALLYPKVAPAQEYRPNPSRSSCPLDPEGIPI